jgi:hypothetical protein
VDSKIGFKNVHYFAAGATLFGADAKGAYLYDGKEYIGAHPHVAAGFDCSTCHNVHALEVKTESCVGCHPGTKDITTIRMGGSDYDGDGNATEGILGEVETLADALYAQVKVYAADKGTGIVYVPTSHPYFFVDKDADGKADKDDKGANIRYNAFTPRLMKAAFNYQYAMKDTGGWAHNGKFVIQFRSTNRGSGRRREHVHSPVIWPPARTSASRRAPDDPPSTPASLMHFSRESTISEPHPRYRLPVRIPSPDPTLISREEAQPPLRSFGWDAIRCGAGKPWLDDRGRGQQRELPGRGRLWSDDAPTRLRQRAAGTAA